MLRICVLAALLVVAGTVWADKTAYFTARYGGWSKEPSCDRGSSDDSSFKRCWVLTLGKDTYGNETVDLSYLCNTKGFEILSFGITPFKSIDTDDPALRVKWDYRHEERIDTWTQWGSGNNPSVWYNIAQPAPFLDKMGQHETLALYLPFKHERDLRAVLPLRGAMRSISLAMRECGISQSKLGDVSG